MSEFDPDDIYRKLTQAGDTWAEAQAAAELLEEVKKTVLAKLGHESGESSAAAREAFALRHPDYTKHLEGMVAARRAANRAKVNYDSMRVLAGLRQTVAANERAANRYAV